MIKIDNSWTLFLDRDGVINVERNNDYVYNPGQFKFYEGILESLEKCATMFSKIVIATNQRGIGRGLMTENNLSEVHNFMLKKINEQNGRIDAIYFAPDLNNDAPNRKPNMGMAHQAKEQFPEIDLKKSIMVGNNLSDMKFGKQAGMITVFVNTTQNQSATHPLIDYSIDNLNALFAILDLTSN